MEQQNSGGFKKNNPIDWHQLSLDITELKREAITYGRIDVFEDRIGRRLQLPIIAITGEDEGPVLGITAAVHGNEINGIPTVHRLAEQVDPKLMKGSIIAVPIVNLPGYLAYQRTFIDGADLNRVMPGKPFGTPSQVYAHNFVQRILSKFTHVVDLHTASFGRINSHYIRADFNDPIVKKLALAQHADIILNKASPEETGSGKTIRQAAMDIGIPGITIELGNPQIFQQHIVDNAIKGIKNIMVEIGMIESTIVLPENKPVICKDSYWTRVNDGGVLKVYPKLTQHVTKGEEIALLYDIYGRKDISYTSPENGVIIGKNVNPVVSSGDRILHLGITN